MTICNVSLQVIPNVEEERIYPVVDKVIEYIDSTIVKNAQDICIKEGAKRVCSMVKIDYKQEGVTMDEKIKKYRE